MNIKKDNSSVVIIGNLHNPTILSGNFLVNSGMISNESEIEHDKVIITPSISRISLVNGAVIDLTPQRLIIINNSDANISAVLATKYCNALKHIKCNAIGINFSFIVSNTDLKKWHKNFEFIHSKGFLPVEFSFSKETEKSLCSVTTKGSVQGKSEILFNYEYKFNSINLEEVTKTLDFVKEFDMTLKNSLELIDSLLL